MFLSQNHGQKALVLLKNGKCGYRSSGNHCLAVVAGQLQLLPYVPSNLATSSVTSWAEFRYWLTARSKTMKSNISHVKPIVHAPPVLPCVVHTHPGQAPPLAHACLILQAEPPARTAGSLPTFYFELWWTAFPQLQHGTAASASPALCFWVAGFHPTRRRKETRKAVRQESGRREFLINSFSQTTFLFETIPIPVFITMHFSFDKCLFHFI